MLIHANFIIVLYYCIYPVASESSSQFKHDKQKLRFLTCPGLPAMRDRLRNQTQAVSSPPF